MKKFFVAALSILTLLAPISLFAQKLVIGSKAPDMKNIEWKSGAPAENKAMIVEFYQSTNPTSVKLFPKLADIKSKHGDKLNVVVITRESNEAIDKLVADYGALYSIGYDAGGKTYESFGVKFVPFTMLVDAKGTLIWQGNLGNITDDNVSKIK